MQIRMNPNKSASGPEGHKLAGQVYTVSAREGSDLVNGGYAVDVSPPVVEHAVIKPNRTLGRGARRK